MFKYIWTYVPIRLCEEGRGYGAALILFSATGHRHIQDTSSVPMRCLTGVSRPPGRDKSPLCCCSPQHNLSNHSILGTAGGHSLPRGAHHTPPHHMTPHHVTPPHGQHRDPMSITENTSITKHLPENRLVVGEKSNSTTNEKLSPRIPPCLVPHSPPLPPRVTHHMGNTTPNEPHVDHSTPRWRTSSCLREKLQY